MAVPHRGSGVTVPSGHTLALHTRTNSDDDLPHATKRYTPLRLKYIIAYYFYVIGLWPIICGSLRVCG